MCQTMLIPSSFDLGNACPPLHLPSALKVFDSCPLLVTAMINLETMVAKRCDRESVGKLNGFIMYRRLCRVKAIEITIYLSPNNRVFVGSLLHVLPTYSLVPTHKTAIYW